MSAILIQTMYDNVIQGKGIRDLDRQAIDVIFGHDGFLFLASALDQNRDDYSNCFWACHKMLDILIEWPYHVKYKQKDGYYEITVTHKQHCFKARHQDLNRAYILAALEAAYVLRGS